MTRTNQDFTIQKGDDETLEITVGDGSGGSKDLSGASIDWGLRKYPDGQDLISKSVSGGGITITDEPGGVFEVDLDPSDTNSLEIDGRSGDFYHEAVVTDSAGNVSTVTTGTATIRE